MNRPIEGIYPAAGPSRDDAEGATDMRLFKRSRRTEQSNRRPTWRERRAAQRTAAAEARLRETEQKIHEIADEVRGDIRESR